MPGDLARRTRVGRTCVPADDASGRQSAPGEGDGARGMGQWARGMGRQPQRCAACSPQRCARPGGQGMQGVQVAAMLLPCASARNPCQRQAVRSPLIGPADPYRPPSAHLPPLLLTQGHH